MNGRINSFQSFGAVDGPGIRFVVFMQGCPLRCIYCHNPETHDFGGGTEYSADEVFDRICRYTPYFSGGGGVTVSGGEPLCQSDFVAQLFELCRDNGISTCLDTSGCVMNESVRHLLSLTDIALLDCKMTNDEDYRRYIGCGKSAFDDFLSVAEKIMLRVWLRQVIVPGINDDVENARKIAEIKAAFSCVEKIELLPFRKLCVPKYETMGIKFPLADTPEMNDQELDGLYSIIYG